MVGGCCVEWRAILAGKKVDYPSPQVFWCGVLHHFCATLGTTHYSPSLFYKYISSLSNRIHKFLEPTNIFHKLWHHYINKVINIVVKLSN